MYFCGAHTHPNDMCRRGSETKQKQKQKKKNPQHSINVLVVIDIICLSSSFPGAWNDSIASQDSSEHWLSKLDGEQELADSDFKSLLEAGHTVFTLQQSTMPSTFLLNNELVCLSSGGFVKAAIYIPTAKKEKLFKHHKVDCCSCTCNRLSTSIQSQSDRW